MESFFPGYYRISQATGRDIFQQYFVDMLAQPDPNMYLGVNINEDNWSQQWLGTDIMFLQP
ncbi:MAG: hypothetical protein OEV49_05430 [candidate division Zixibacteria bacterium]|nr:hypothetical protein [candidate division Zixibacteria bacterium]MDH3936718.1 hypothetical protein [candidate division Zixibacteria bacterium]MDH4032571.1 hypothetical protein [candidate division Zixibacteria bacterium]